MTAPDREPAAREAPDAPLADNGPGSPDEAVEAGVPETPAEPAGADAPQPPEAPEPPEPAEAPEPPAPPDPPEPPEFREEQAVADELAVTRMELAERTSDLQRLQAEFVNYKRRVERDRELVRQNATYAVLTPIIEVLDTIDRAREHGPLEGGFQAVADQLERVVAGLGLTKFGVPGDPFDPTLHEALSHIGEDPQVEVTTCKVVAKAGYRIGDRVVRAAQVLVVDPMPRAAEGGVEPQRSEETTPPLQVGEPGADQEQQDRRTDEQ